MAEQTPEEKAAAELESRIQTRVAEETKGLKEKNAELLGANQKLKARANVIGDRSPEEVQADLELAAKFKEDKAKAAGDFEVLKKEMAEKAAAREAALKKEIEDRDAELFDVVGKNAAIEAISKAGGKVKKLIDPVMKSIRVVPGEDGKRVARVVDAKGNQRIVDGQGTAMTIDQLVETFKADDDYANDFAASGSNGSGARNESSNRNTGGVVVIPKDADVVTYRRMKADAEKRGVPYQVAS